MHPPRPLPPYLLDDAPDPSPDVAWFDSDVQTAPQCPDFEGLQLFPEAITRDEERQLLETIEATPFTPAQGGKDKQHFGPRVNFKKRKITVGAFTGLPPYVGRIEAIAQTRLTDVAQAAYRNFEATDAFVLRYCPRRQSNLDLHIDDTFSYGEVILALSLESDSVLTFVRSEAVSGLPACVRVPIPARSLSVLYGPARFHWTHGILAQDIQAQRTSITIRTLSPSLKDSPIGQEILSIARATKAASFG